MPRTRLMVPYGADQTVYLVIDRCGRPGCPCCETEEERGELETVITELMSGQFNEPIRILAFNTLEHWSDDISEDVALEIETRCDIDGVAIPSYLKDFVASHGSPTRNPAAFRRHARPGLPAF